MQRRDFMSGVAGAALIAGPCSVRAQQTVWEDVASADGCYRLQMPRGYRYLQVPAQGGVLHSYATMLPDRFTLELLDMAFAAPQPKVPTAPAEFQLALEEMQGGMQKSWPGSTVLEQRQIMTGSVTGREFVLAAEQGGRFVIVRLYLTPKALYTQTAQGPAAEQRSALVTQFMASLQFG